MNYDKNDILNYLSKFFNDSPSKITILEQLLGGMSNKVYKIEYNNKLYTIRIPGRKASYFVDRKLEKIAIKEMEKLGITNNTIHFSVSDGIKISEYIEGKVLSKESDIDAYLEGIALILKKIHHSNSSFPYHYDLVNRLLRYESYNNIQDGDYYYLKEQWLRLYEEKYKNEKLVLCHGDAQRSNIITDNGKLYIFDFEYTGLNSVYYDIASFGNLGFNDSIKLLRAYLKKEPDNTELDKLRFYRLFQVLQWHQVAKFKAEIGLGEDLNLDFNIIAGNYLKIAHELYNSIGDK